MSKRYQKASSLYQLSRAQFGFSFGVPVGVVSDKLRDAGRDADAALLEWYRDVKEEEARSPWLYNGDVNLEYGGTFVKLEDWHHGYCEFVKVTDLASACGFEGAVLIEHGTANGTDDARRIRQALRSCGCSAREFNFGLKDGLKAKQCIRHMIADALISYGYCDYDEMRQEVVQMLPDGPMEFDGWKADKRLHNTDLEAYVKAVHLKD